MFSKILFTLEMVALIAAPIGYLQLRDHRAEQFFDKANAALLKGEWGKAYACYQEAARRDTQVVKASAACRLTLCKDFGLGVAPAEQLEICPLHGSKFADCLEASRVPTTKVLEAAKQGLFESGSTDLIVWGATAYRKGSSFVPQSYPEAVAWYRAAAARGNVSAQSKLIGLAYDYKNRWWSPKPDAFPSEWLLNVEQEPSGAHILLHEYIAARLFLGERIAAGDETLAQHPEATDWLSEAAMVGNEDAQAILGVKLAKGETIDLSQETTIRCFLAAANRGDEMAKQALIDRVTKMSKPDLKKYSNVITWVEVLAQQGDQAAQACLGVLMTKGHWEAGTPAEQLTYLQKGAEAGNADAQFMLGIRYHVGDGVERDRKVAAQWFQKAAEQGHAKAQYELAQCYKMGWGVPQSRELAEKWLYESAKNGNEDAKRGLPLRLRYKFL